MLVKKVAVTLFCFVLLAICRLEAQVQVPSACTTLGQTPATAFPICAKDTFIQSTVPLCVNKQIKVPGCSVSTGSYADLNPFWYRFTCYQSGSLAFLITPNNLGDDYDWQLFDITNVTDLDQVYTNTKLFVVANWAGTYGLTGASVKGQLSVTCASDPPDNVNTFSIMPSLVKDHTYLLLVSHYSDTQSGYKLSFGNGTAVITDPNLPDLKKATPFCDASTVTLKLNKKIKCNSLAGDGSDFTIAPALATVVSATAASCSSNFDMDSVTIILSNPLPAGNYSLVIKKGDDQNTLLDDCDRDIPEGHQVPFTVAPPQPTLPDSIIPPLCAPSQLQLVFKKNIHCSSVAPDGSDFIISGPAPVTVTAADGACRGELSDFSSTITLTLASPVTKGGTYQVKLKDGTDGNTIIDECGLETPSQSTVSFMVKDTVSANFNYSLLLGCKTDTVLFAHDGSNGVNQWFWIFDGSGASTAENNTVVFNTFGTKQIALKVSNGFCSDSTTKTVLLDNSLIASFETNSLLCPENAAIFKNNSIGKNITDYSWIFGDGSTSMLQAPDPKKYPVTGKETNYPVKLIVRNVANCFDTAINNIKVLRSCYIAVPNAFTPNGDGLNDYLYPLNAFKADNLNFNVYNRLGQMVFHSTDWTQKWDGKINSEPQGTGVFVWTLQYVDRDSGKKIFLKGTSVLIR
ncbi:MAG: gliding motility-associated C-terminal domain-containing protein [Bacteroidota bacterium]